MWYRTYKIYRKKRDVDVSAWSRRTEERRVEKVCGEGEKMNKEEDGIRDGHVNGVQTCALPIYCVILLKRLFKKSGKNNTSNFSVLFILLLNAFYKIVSIVNTCGIELIKYTGKRGMLMLALGVGERKSVV